jgi:hypothetical protein
MLASERRAHFRKNLSSLYVPFYDALCAQLGPEWQPYSSFRSMADQDALYAKGRTSAPLGIQYRVTNAKGGQSAHNYGCASDWTWFDGETLVWLKREDPRWKTYLDAVTKVGLRLGVEFGDVDHNEVKLTCDWPHIWLAYQQGGMTSAQNHIAENLAPKTPLT